MSECYKCGRATPEGQLECDPPCFGNPEEDDLTPEQIAENIRDYESKTTPIDWDKVQTLNDLKEVFRNLLLDDRVWKNSDEYQQLKRFLKSE